MRSIGASDVVAVATNSSYRLQSASSTQIVTVLAMLDSDDVVAMHRELDAYLVQTRSRAIAHRLCSERLNKFGLALHLPVIALNIISAVLSYFLQYPDLDDNHTYILIYFIICFTTITAIVVAIDNFLDLLPLATKHRLASKQYDSLGLRIAKYKSISGNRLESRCNKALRLIEELVTNPEIPPVPMRIETRAARLVQAQNRLLAINGRSPGRSPLQTASSAKPSPRDGLVHAVVGILSPCKLEPSVSTPTATATTATTAAAAPRLGLRHENSIPEQQHGSSSSSISWSGGDRATAH
jgi:hypothetical protein